MRAMLLGCVLAAVFTAGIAAAPAPSSTAAVTSALQTHELAVAKRVKPKASLVECRTVFSHTPIVECDTYTLTPSPVAKQISFSGQPRWVSRVAEAYRSSGCVYRVSVSVGSTLATVYTSLLNVCRTGWVRQVSA